MNQLSFLQPVNRFRQRIGAAVVAAAYRRLDFRFAQSLAVPDGYLLRPPIAVMNQGISTFKLSVVQSLLQSVEHKVYAHGTALTPTHNPTCMDVYHTGHVFRAVMEKAKQTYPLMPFYEGLGLKLQSLKGAIMMKTMERLMKLNIIPLPIHDAIMVPSHLLTQASSEATLKDVWATN